jgi:hypothetical protein
VTYLLRPHRIIARTQHNLGLRQVTATLSLHGKVVASGRARANNQGRWAVPLGRPKAGTGYAVTATTQAARAKRTISIRDVQVRLSTSL